MLLLPHPHTEEEWLAIANLTHTSEYMTKQQYHQQAIYTFLFLFSDLVWNCVAGSFFFFYGRNK